MAGSRAVPRGVSLPTIRGPEPADFDLQSVQVGSKQSGFSDLGPAGYFLQCLRNLNERET